MLGNYDFDGGKALKSLGASHCTGSIPVSGINNLKRLENPITFPLYSNCIVGSIQNISQHINRSAHVGRCEVKIPECHV